MSKVLGVKVEDDFYNTIKEHGKISDVLRSALEYYLNNNTNIKVNHTEEQVNQNDYEIMYYELLNDLKRLISLWRGF